ncbi:MAG: bifunctional phosphoribosyl-AMP cyclohydrolase/phosphoribosyl-ATP diphosphatase HisIE [Lachnospiraceae bacterium]|nr:bifunctional phosphoribosyl-AMP cyclohydrolase/phosphoribosyl-ATP diphosphatase HisIE [Lachnospiraceae bacterium]
MGVFKLIPVLFMKDGVFVEKTNHSEIIEESPKDLVYEYSNNGADEVMIFDVSSDEKGHDKTIRSIITIADYVDIKLLVGGNIESLEDVKKYLYTGAKKVILDAKKLNNIDMIKDASDRFGSDKVAVLVDKSFDFSKVNSIKYDGASLIIADDCAEKIIGNGIKVLAYNGTNSFEDIITFSQNDKIYGVAHDEFNLSFDYMDFKHQLKEQGIKVSILESKYKFQDFKLNSDGMIPVVVQDYKTNEVLMVAYMNEEAYNLTIKTGKMTYFSRSRNEIWVKGLTSGHFQYVKELKVDCDYDTILAKVCQVGVPCHTGAETCFFNELVKTDYEETNPIKVFEKVYNIIQDRKANPKEGSYTNYLIDKGIDKILKKVGEEATEIIIAAKNPDPQELKYEISDFLYHTMVLMVEKGITWKDITKELSRR